jgi:hypoxanthine-DNA glycosylase
MNSEEKIQTPQQAVTERLTAFPPLVDTGSRLLILGSMPSEASLRRRQYYGHPQNHFWRLVHALWGAQLSDLYDDRMAFLGEHQLALWDVLATCRRRGSSDSEIRDGEANDFTAFFARWPNLEAIAFNGRAAAALFARLVVRPLGWTVLTPNRPPLTLIQLGSTSPAHAVPFDERLSDWMQIVNWLEANSLRPG